MDKWFSNLVKGKDKDGKGVSANADGSAGAATAAALAKPETGRASSGSGADASPSSSGGDLKSKKTSPEKTTFLEDLGGFAKRLSSFKLKPNSKGDIKKLNEAALIPKERLAVEAERFLSSATEYAKIELEGTLSELELLQQMNQVTAAKYSEMASTAEGLRAFAQDLHKKKAELEPVFAEIEAMEKAAAELEGIVNQLDDYSRRLEAKARAMGGA